MIRKFQSEWNFTCYYFLYFYTIYNPKFTSTKTTKTNDKRIGLNLNPNTKQKDQDKNTNVKSKTQNVQDLNMNEFLLQWNK
jgi:hypothetical protein